MVKIFLIHREPTFAPLLRRKLKMNVRIESTNSLHGVAEKVKDFNPDVLLVSGRLIGGTGAEALRAIRKAGCKALAIAISSDQLDNYNDKIAAVGNEFNDLIVPVVRDATNNIDALREALGKYGPLHP